MAATTTAMASGGAKRKRPHKQLCGVPAQYCIGFSSSAGSAFKGSCKMHTSAEEAYKCHANYLVKQEGYTAGPNREFYKEGCPTRVLTKKVRFGGRMRGGKGDRQIPQQFVGGCVISC